MSFLDEDLLVDPTKYRSMAGALQYLTMTRPNIFYDVNIRGVHKKVKSKNRTKKPEIDQNGRLPNLKIWD